MQGALCVEVVGCQAGAQTSRNGCPLVDEPATHQGLRVGRLCVRWGRRRPPVKSREHAILLDSSAVPPHCLNGGPHSGRPGCTGVLVGDTGECTGITKAEGGLAETLQEGLLCAQAGAVSTPGITRQGQAAGTSPSRQLKEHSAHQAWRTRRRTLGDWAVGGPQGPFQPARPC